MKGKLIVGMAILLIAYPYILTAGDRAAQARVASLPNSTQGLFSAEELDDLMAPIALYPDPLLAQILPAATFVDQVMQAAAWLKRNNNAALITSQPWDSSVMAVAQFPDVLFRMADYPDWTTSLGQAYVAQQSDVSASIQRLRQEARTRGALITTPQQIVAVQEGFVTILPAQPNVIYVPVYSPAAVWGPSTGAVVASNLVSFGTGLALGSWWGGWGRGWGWGGRGIYNINNTVVNINRGVIGRRNNWRHGRPSPGRPGGGRPGGGGIGGNRPNIPGTPGRPGGGRPGGGGVGGNRPNMPNIPGRPGGERPGRPGAGIGGNRPNMPNIPGRPGGERPGRPGAGIGANRPNMPNVPGTPGRPGGGRHGRPGASAGMRPSMPGRGGSSGGGM